MNDVKKIAYIDDSVLERALIKEKYPYIEVYSELGFHQAIEKNDIVITDIMLGHESYLSEIMKLCKDLGKDLYFVSNLELFQGLEALKIYGINENKFYSKKDIIKILESVERE